MLNMLNRLLRLALAAAVLAPLAAAAQSSAADRPNVVLIITDDLGWADLGSYGAPDIETPSIDSLARDGIRLTDFYSNGVMCTPTRAGLITGRYQQRYGFEAALPAETETGLPVTGRSLPQLLKDNGYATALVGKWHLGDRLEYSPNAHGFDYFFGFKAGFHDYYTHRNSSGNLDLWQDEQRADVEGYTTDLITARAIGFIQQNASGPFFIDVAYNAPHWPYQRPDSPSVAPGNARHVLPADPGTSTREDYVALVERMDRGVGDILATLERLGIADDTLVIFTNDNGGEWLASNAPLFGRKMMVWEGGIRVPALIRWPGRIPAGRVSDQVAITMDLTATILAVTGTPVPADAGLEGIDLMPVLEGRAPEVERTLFWRSLVAGRRQRAVRQGDWKLVVDHTHTFVYDLRTDIGERHDLANRRQDVAQRLMPLLVAWERDVDAELESRAASAPRGSAPTSAPAR